MQDANQIIVRQILDAIRPSISPIFIIKPQRTGRFVTNGTIFFINYNSDIYALTAHHVHTDLNIFEGNSINRNIRIIDQIFFEDLNPTIALIDEQKDVVIYNINNMPTTITPFGGNLLQNSDDISNEATLVTMGLPGGLREVNGGNIVFGIYSSFPIVDDISHEGRLSIQIDPAQMQPIDGMEIPPSSLNLGGMSGAPIFWFKQGVIETWELCGIVTRSIFGNTFGGILITSDLFTSINGGRT